MLGQALKRRGKHFVVLLKGKQHPIDPKIAVMSSPISAPERCTNAGRQFCLADGFAHLLPRETVVSYADGHSEIWNKHVYTLHDPIGQEQRRVLLGVLLRLTVRKENYDPGTPRRDDGLWISGERLKAYNLGEALPGRQPSEPRASTVTDTKVLEVIYEHDNCLT